MEGRLWKARRSVWQRVESIHLDERACLTISRQELNELLGEARRQACTQGAKQRHRLEEHEEIEGQGPQRQAEQTEEDGARSAASAASAAAAIAAEAAAADVVPSAATTRARALASGHGRVVSAEINKDANVDDCVLSADEGGRP